MPDVTIPDTPMTRTEQYLAAANGQEVELPDPMTREETYLHEIATKMQGGGSSVTVEPLYVAENGTYPAPPGQAYSPVTVDVDPDEWHRPADWPDLDSITLGSDTDYDELYLTYDLSKTEGYGWVGLMAVTTDSADWTVERGHISGAEFVADETHTVAGSRFGSYFRQALDPSHGNVQLWRVRAYKMTRFGFATNSATDAENFNNMLQPCVEMVGRLGFLTWGSSSEGTGRGFTSYGTTWLERFGVDIDASSISGGTMFAGCFSLRLIDGEILTSQTLINPSAFFNQCVSLKSIDLSGWDMSAVTNASNLFKECFNLRTINAEGIDLSHLSQNAPTFNYLYNLVEYYPLILSVSQDFSKSNKLSKASVLRIIDSLPEVSSTKTLTLGQSNKNKLTAEQIAIATEKGWTVA